MIKLAFGVLRSAKLIEAKLYIAQLYFKIFKKSHVLSFYSIFDN